MLLLFSVFKECFFFHAKKGYTQTDQQLGLMMRSLSYSPTEEEIHQYFNKFVKGKKTIIQTLVVNANMSYLLWGFSSLTLHCLVFCW